MLTVARLPLSISKGQLPRAVIGPRTGRPVAGAIGLGEQIFGADKQVSGRGQSDEEAFGPTRECRVGRAELITSPALLTCPGRQWLGPFPSMSWQRRTNLWRGIGQCLDASWETLVMSQDYSRHHRASAASMVVGVQAHRRSSDAGLRASPAIPNLRCEFGFSACRLLAGCRGTGGWT